MRMIENEAYLSTLRELTQEGREVSLVIKGSSMVPFLADGRDTIFFREPDTPLRAGDIVFYQRPGGQFVVHRICRIRDGQLYLVGDAQSEIEGPLDPSLVFARVTRVKRKGKLIGPDDLIWKFFERVWIHMIPCRYPLMRMYAALRRLLHRTQGI